MPIEVKNLDKDKMARWLQTAIEIQKNDPVFSFIASWIAFNYYYASFPSENRWVQFERWCTQSKRDPHATTAQLQFLLESKEFTDFFKSFREDKIFDDSIGVPVWNSLHGGFIRENVKAKMKKWIELSDEQIIIDVLYRIRNNLFHGQKDPRKSNRDLEVSTAACNFMIPFLTELLKATHT